MKTAPQGKNDYRVRTAPQAASCIDLNTFFKATEQIQSIVVLFYSFVSLEMSLFYNTTALQALGAQNLSLQHSDINDTTSEQHKSLNTAKQAAARLKDLKMFYCPTGKTQKSLFLFK